MKPCLICQSPIESFLSFGQMPPANAYLTQEQFQNEYFFELAVGFCTNCLMVQLINTVDPTRLFHEEYAYISSTSRYMQSHFAQFANDLIEKHLNNQIDPFVVEIGCNDGIMLKNFAQRGIRHLGVEPSDNVAKLAIANELIILKQFFTHETAQTIANEYGKADLICAANVIGHINDLHSVANGIRHLLKENGLFVFEHPYIFDNLSSNAYDQIYSEHTYYFSVHSVINLFKIYDLELVDLTLESVHGGSIRYTLAKKGQQPVTERVHKQLAHEENMGIHKPDTYHQFALRTANSRDLLVKTLKSLKNQGKRVMGYGATAKSSTVLNYCQIGPDLLECICDVTPTKQGKYSPGMHIPIRSFDTFQANPPDVVLLFAWNHAEEIMSKEHNFTNQGGQWLLYIPDVHILSQPQIALKMKEQ